MGPINWLAVVLSANLAIAVGFVWYGPLFGGSDLFGRASGEQVTAKGQRVDQRHRRRDPVAGAGGA